MFSLQHATIVDRCSALKAKSISPRHLKLEPLSKKLGSGSHLLINMAIDFLSTVGIHVIPYVLYLQSYVLVALAFPAVVVAPFSFCGNTYTGIARCNFPNKWKRSPADAL